MHEHFEFFKRGFLVAEREARARVEPQRFGALLGIEVRHELLLCRDGRSARFDVATEAQVCVREHHVRGTATTIGLSVDQEPLQRLHRELRVVGAECAVAEQEVVVAELAVAEVAEVGRLAQRQHRLVHAARPSKPTLRFANDEPHVEHLDRVLQSHDARRELSAAAIA